jgi:chromosome partitioning protein
MIISVLNQKGGTGKTTLAVNLARAYTKRGIKTLLVDSDSQGSAQRWHERSGGELIDMTCLPMTTLDKDVLKYVDHYDRIIIDGIPRVSPLTICAIKCANLILIPVQPSPYDIWATEDLVRNVQDRISMTDGKTKAAFVVSRKIVGTNLGKEIEPELLKLELAVFKSGTCQRVAYAESVKNGLSVLDGEYEDSEACKEIEQIINEIEGWPNGQENHQGGL